MFKLSLSLLLSAICALFMLGAVLDQLANDDSQPAPDQLQLYTTVLDTISQQADRQQPAQLSAFITAQQQHWQLALHLLPRDSLALPPELEVKLRKQEEKVTKYKREDTGLRFTITCLVAFAVFQAGLLIWIATHR